MVRGRPAELSTITSPAHPHRWTHRRFQDRLVDRIVLRAFDEGLYEARIDEAHFAAGGELPPAPYDACEKKPSRVSSLSLVRHRGTE
jgi:hypothetical protein